MAETSPTILWDFDGTLVAMPGLFRSALKAALDEFEPDHRVDDEQIRPFLRTGFPWHKPEEPHLHLVTPEAWWLNLETVFTRAYQGVGFDVNRAQELAKHVHKYVVDPQRYLVYNDTIPALKNLKARGWKHAILSNHVPELPDIVKALGLSSYVDFCITSAAIGYEKPNPEAFQIALSIIGHPKKVWMIGDNLNADVRGAEAIGLQAIPVRNTGNEKVHYFARDLVGAVSIVEASN